MPTTYPLDLTGNAGTNLITNELHTFNIAADRIFPLTAGPFYTIGLEVYHGVTNQLLQPVTQYKALHLHRDASLASGKEVCAVIIVEDATIPSVRVKYHCIGGLYSNEASLIQDLIDNNPIANDDVVWGQIIGIPVQFPPTEHLHHFDNIYGAEEMVAVLERIRMAIAAGDSPAISAIYQYIHTLLTNLNYTTEQDVIDLIGDDNVQYVKTYDSYTELRAETNVINNESYLYVATGKAARNDRKGRIFMWDITSTADDDNDMVLRPHPIPPTNPGRFVSMLGVETELRDALATIGRKIDEDGNILTDLQATFPLETVDLDDVINSGVYWVKPDCTNKPAGNTQGHLFVEKNDIYVVQRFISTVQDDRNMVGEGDTNITVPTAHTFNRVGRLVGGNYVWEDWRGLIDRDTLNIALQSLGRKIDEDFKVRSDLVNGTNNTFTGDLNTLIQPGPWYVAPTSTNMPIGAERGTVDVLQSGIFISQTFSSIIQEYDITDVSQTVTNGPDVIRPTVFKRILTLNANLDTVDTVGEWISFADLPTINRALRTLGRKVENDFTITTDYAAIGLSIDGDLNDVRDVGHYWVTPTATNKPAGAFDGYLTVINTNIWYTQIYVSTFHDVDYLNVNSNPAVGAAKIFIRNGYFTPGNPNPWQPWQPIVDLDTVNNALLTLGRSINPDYSLDTNISSFITPLTGSTNLNDIVKPGIYPLLADADNSTPHSNWPLGVYRGIMIVESTYLGGVSTELHTFQEIITSYDNDEQGDPVSQNPFLDGTIKPTVYRRIRENNSWTSWYKTLDTQDAKRHGLTTTGIAANNTVPALTSGNPTDLDSYTMPGKYWVGAGIVNSAFEWGLLEVELIGGTATEPGEIIQTMRSPLINGKYCQRMRYWDTLFNQHTWTGWYTLAMQNGDSAQFFEASYPEVPTPFHVINGAKLATQFATLWARLTANGIDATIGATNVLPAYTDLDGVINVGKYWVGHSSGYYNSPFDYGILEVEKIDANNIIQTMYDELRRTSRRTNSAGTWWTEWTFSQNLNIAYESSRDSRDLDWTLIPGEYYYTPNTISRPTPYGLVKVWRENSDIVYQQAHSSDNTFHIRYRDDLGVWTAWSTPLTQSTLQSTLIIHPKPSTYTVPVGGYTDVVLKPYGTLKVWMVSGGGGGASAESINEAVGTDETQQPGGQSGVWLMIGGVPILIAACTGGGIGTAPRSDYEESPSMAGGANGANGTYVTTSYGTIDVLEAGVAPIPSTMIGNKFPSTFTGQLGVGTAPLAPFNNFQGGGGGGNGSYASIIVKNDSTTDAVTLRLYSGAGGINDNERGGYANNGRLEYAIA